ncbi:MAG: ATP-binding protein [Cyanophyceae cyanobacterium]
MPTNASAKVQLRWLLVTILTHTTIVMLEALALATAGYMPHGYCYLWNPGLVWLHVASDLLTAVAYYSIPITLFYFIRKRSDFPYPRIFILFGAFIIACGTTHLMEIWSLWHSNYWVSGYLKSLTALISIYTAIELIPVVPQALALPSPAQLEETNQHLEQRVLKRTAQLEAVNQVLKKEIAARQQAAAERNRLLAREQEARAAAERANRIKDEFLAILSHELRTPLNPILGWAQALQTYQFDATQTAEALATIERNAQLQVQLINDLLDIAGILRGKLRLNPTAVNLSLVIEAALETVRMTAVAKSIALHAVLPDIGLVFGDAARLQQIVWNLLTNAVKFTPEGGQVYLELKRVGEQAQIAVRDTGKGISSDFLPHVFKSFCQEDASITRLYGGLGLGLAIVHQLVEEHGGTIEANSPGEGLGATFTLQLPLLKDEVVQPLDELPRQEFNLAGIRVLGVDDEPDARKLLTVLLTECGAEVLTVASAAEVLALLESFQPDVLVSDIGMPDMNGLTLVQRIRTLPSEKGGRIPAIALTASARVEDCQQVLASGYQQHIAKPLKISHLAQAVAFLATQQDQRLPNQQAAAVR